MMNAYETIFTCLQQLRPSDRTSARLFHNAMEYSLKKYCHTVIREYQVANRGDGRRGFIDLVILDPFRAAVELDNASPRKNSIFKLNSMTFMEKFVVLRKDCRIIRL